MMKTRSFRYGAKHATSSHKHAAGQVYWLDHGIMVIETTLSQWTVTPGTVGWFPPGLEHSAWVPGNVTGHSLYIDPPACINFPLYAGIYGADAFTTALLNRCQNSGSHSTPDYQETLLKLLGYEVMQCTALPLELRLPTDQRARNVANELLNNPASHLDQSQLAQQFGLSVRSLSRLFNQQAGLSFSQWRQQAKILASLQWILAGLPVYEVASLSGYSNVSAYIDVFRQRFGKTPAQFQLAWQQTG
ncbi:helix-turn-helix transcriptional regulator [Pantoea sp. ACRSB]|uniref:AraC family transcriptional regulator n=1 Tax=Pantoea sp. ACRSB TaxID=2918207 RepID=UPI002892A780|nr:helix-turn-helix transcriptional regulator [Pantoea sp. ACRSB]MCG7387358.1 helix-turn-helix transcriptional regulator [Pantoea sp. ACRSB]